MNSDDKKKDLKEDSFKDTSLKEIRRKVLAYHEKMNAIARFLLKKNAPPELQIDTTKEFMEYYIEKSELDKLVEIAKLPGCERLVVFHGLAIENNSVTGCFLGLDKDYQILDQHRKSSSKGGGVPGQDTWIPPGNGKAERPQDYTLDTPYHTLNEVLHD